SCVKETGKGPGRGDRPGHRPADNGRDHAHHQGPGPHGSANQNGGASHDNSASHHSSKGHGAAHEHAAAAPDQRPAAVTAATADCAAHGAGRHGPCAQRGGPAGPHALATSLASSLATSLATPATTPAARAVPTAGAPHAAHHPCGGAAHTHRPHDGSGCGGHPHAPHQAPCGTPGPAGPTAPGAQSNCGHTGGGDHSSKRGIDKGALPAATDFQPPRTADGRPRDTASPLHERPHDVVEHPG
ncbi:hypothetical protein AAHZ94_15610, partial [Streptomyces sp. HSW2009]